MGPTDLLKPLIERYLDGVIHFGRVSVKPGKPTTFAQVPVIQGDHTIWKPVFALPGNPASALVTFYVFVVPALRKMGGWPDRLMELPKVAVQVCRQLRSVFLMLDNVCRYRIQCRWILVQNSTAW
jgi:gephyrin